MGRINSGASLTAAPRECEAKYNHLQTMVVVLLYPTR